MGERRNPNCTYIDSPVPLVCSERNYLVFRERGNCDRCPKVSFRSPLRESDFKTPAEKLADAAVGEIISGNRYDARPRMIRKEV